MNQTSVDDFTATILSTWYAVASQWMPPGDTNPLCVTCFRSPVMDVVDVSDYPHDVIHELVVPIGIAVEHVRISLAEEHPSDAAPALVGVTARQMVSTSLLGRSDELHDVLENCIRYRMDDFITLELEHNLLKYG